MTSVHSDRANGDSYFTAEELESAKLYLEYVSRRSRQKESDEIAILIDKCTKEIEYIKSIKSK